MGLGIVADFPVEDNGQKQMPGHGKVHGVQLVPGKNNSFQIANINGPEQEI